jgi:cell fate (sporulation/competence/biofilm development) regulator YlbF (YheA/YmcA/DUF963 family)
MATTEEIISKAEELGKMIANHNAAQQIEKVAQKLEKDIEAQRALNDYNRCIAKIGERESQGKPIEVEDKRILEKLQQQVIMNPLLREFQVAQMDYVDLMRRVDEAMMSRGEPMPHHVLGETAPADLSAVLESNPDTIDRTKK